MKIIRCTKSVGWFAIALVLATHAGAAVANGNGHGFEAGRLPRVQALHDPFIDGTVPAYYTRGYQKHAQGLQHFLAGERAFVRKELGVDVPLSLAVLDQRQWKLVERQLPYPMPSVTGSPPVALMPADWAVVPDFFPRQSDADPTLVRAVLARGISWDEANHRADDLIGGHELGHAELAAYGIEPGTRWLNEMLASYVLYAYLQQERRDLLWLVPLMQAGNQTDRPQHHVSLEDFEAQYMQILTTDGENYSWYQGQFLEQVKKVYSRKGIAFLREVRTAFPRGEKAYAAGNAETLRRLERIDPGFIAWAHSLETGPKLPMHAGANAAKRPSSNEIESI